MRSDIIQRVISVIRATTDDRRRLKQLEEETGIPDRNWKQVWSRKQRPTAHMLEALARRWPQYAFWVMTGITDEANGHTAPSGAWTCGQEKSDDVVEESARKYFELKLFVQDCVYGPSGAVDSNYIEKKNPTEEELAQAKIDMTTSDNPAVQAYLDKHFGKEITVWKKKHSDLDEAIAQIAFDRRIDLLKGEYFDFDGDRNASLKANRLLEKLQAARQEAARREE